MKTSGNDHIRYERCILGTCCIPWDDEIRFAEGIFRAHVRRLLETGTDHLYIFGTAGEGHAVSDPMFEGIARAFVDEMSSGGGHPMVGVISTSLRTILHRIELVRELGVRDFQISIPSWGECSFTEAHRFFEEVCTRFPDCRFIHYNTVRGGRVLVASEYAELASAFENFVGTKNTADSLISVIRLLEGAPQLRHFLTEFPFAEASLLGYEAGFLISVAGTNWRRAKDFYGAAVRGDRERVAADIIELQRLHSAVLSLRSDRRMSDGAYDKLYHKIADKEFPLRLLAPYEFFGDEEFARLLDIAAARRPAWIE